MVAESRRGRRVRLDFGGMRMQFGILGPLQAVEAGVGLRLGGRNQRVVLATLLCRPNQVVTKRALIEAVWDQAPPKTAGKNLQVYVHHLRRLLGEDRVVWQAAGYLASVQPGELDAWTFEELVGQGRAAIACENPQRGRDLLAAALGLWRGQAFADLADVPALQATASRLAEAQQAVIEERLEVELALGGARSVLTELSALVLEYPLRERLRGQHMVALYRCGRTGEALQSYQDGRRILADEFGTEPGEALQAVHLAILKSADPAPTLPRKAPTRSAIPGALTPHQLPADIPSFTGRRSELAALHTMLAAPATDDPPPVVGVLTGPAGVGKTALALHWAHQVADAFPDGQLYVDLHGFSEVPPMTAGDALAILLRGLGITSDQIPSSLDEAAALYRSRVAARRLLLVLDNARTAEQVRPLLPGTPLCLAVVTSRLGLQGLVARQGARLVALDVLPAGESVELLVKALNQNGRRVDPAELAAVTDLAAVCGHLPLTLRVAAAQLAASPRQSVPNYVAELRAGDRLQLLTPSGDPASAVRTVFGQSYRHLAADDQRLFRLLGITPGRDFDGNAAAALADIDTPHAASSLRRLTDAHLVTTSVTPRFALHDLMRDYASSLVTEGERSAAVARLLDWYLDGLNAAARAAYPTVVRLPGSTSIRTFDRREQAMAWLDAERSNLLAAVGQAARLGHSERAWRLVDGLRGYLCLIRAPRELLTATEMVLAGLRDGANPAAEAAVRMAASHALVLMLDLTAAEQHVRIAAKAAQAADWCEGYAQTQNLLSSIQLNRGLLDDAIRLSQEALAAYRRAGHMTGQAISLGRLGLACMLRGRLTDALGYQHQAMEFHRASAGLQDQAVTLTNLAETLHLLGRHDEARQTIKEALRLYADIGHPPSEGTALMCLATIERDCGDLAEARMNLERAWDHVSVADHAIDRTAAAHLSATIAAAQGDQTTAERHFTDALETAATLQLRHPEADIRISYANALHAWGQHEQALHQAEQALRLAEKGSYDLVATRARASMAAFAGRARNT
jgi:DNA-binding SARP family transcriptional activator/tetratricopeptide (TPR) repeat protein